MVDLETKLLFLNKMWLRSQRLINVLKLVEVKSLSTCKIVFLSIAECEKEGGGKGKLGGGRIIPLLSTYSHFNFASISVLYSPTLS